MDGWQLKTLIEQHAITFMQATPATWRLLLDSQWNGKSDLVAICGGEALPAELAERLRSRVSRLWNFYGPTETTIWSTAYEVKNKQQPDPWWDGRWEIRNATSWMRSVSLCPWALPGNCTLPVTVWREAT